MRAKVKDKVPEHALVMEPATLHVTAPLGEILIERGLIDAAQLKGALLQQEASGALLGRLLVDLGLIDERALSDTLGEHFGLESVDLRSVDPDEEVLSKISEADARALGVLPLHMEADELHVVVADPTSQKLSTVSETVECSVRFFVAPASDVRRAIDRVYRATAGLDSAVEAFQSSESIRQRDTLRDDGDAESAPIVQVVNMLIAQGLRDRASDIHIEPQEGRMRIRFRTDGKLRDVLALPPNMGPAVISRIKIMAGMNIVERRRSQDGRIEVKTEGRDLDIRVATSGTIWGEKAVLRLLDKSRPLYRLEELGMPPDVRDAFSRLVHAPFGMVVCAGPTGSGKTTTLYAILKEINHPDVNIITIEDPVEYILPSINQIQINEAAGIAFATELKAILRQDPDVILLGEVRDVDTARIAVQSTLTGHFVLSSVHATDAAGALHRFLDMGIEPYLITSSVIAVLAQRLVRRICSYCREEYRPTVQESAFLAAVGSDHKKRLVRGTGCNFCGGTGFEDRIGIFELLQVDDEMKQALVENPTHKNLRRIALRGGMHPLQHEAVQLVEAGITTLSEVMRALYIS
ncbi:MAG TPA: ATPase, T2SS/T4P/T4SS family [Actinomycetota bacterium]|nr:ATPase, T2SS/T4P/T4SS family [Actinomycetota bacterium]